MPMVRVDWFPGRSVDQKRELVAVLTKEICRIAHCHPETVTFMFNDVSRDDWGRAGSLFCDEYAYDAPQPRK